VKFFKSRRWKKLQRSSIEGAYLFVSLAASAAVLWWFLPLWVAAVMLAVTIAHEFGHYFKAVYHGSDAWLPFFVPLVFGLYGAVYVATDEAAERVKFVLAGAPVGAFIALAIAIGCAITSFMPGVWLACWQIIFQLFSGTWGSDGRKYRRCRKEMAKRPGNVHTESFPGKSSTIPATH